MSTTTITTIIIIPSCNDDCEKSSFILRIIWKHKCIMPRSWTLQYKYLRLVKGKGKFVPVLLTEHHAIKAYWGNGGISPRILDLGTRWRWVVSFTQRPLYTQGKSPWYPLDRRMGGPQSRSGRRGVEKNSQPLPVKNGNTSEILKLCILNTGAWAQGMAHCLVTSAL
jgi:hypothetical protein